MNDGVGRSSIRHWIGVRLARAVYFENDERARIKKAINLALGSAYVEEKSYQDYRRQS